MIMRLFGFKLFFIVCFLVSSLGIKAQDVSRNKYVLMWHKLMPRYAKTQFAGSMGMISAGVGWDYGKDRWETDLLFGLVPRNADRHAMVTMTLKQNYIPWKVPIKDKFSFEPLTCGMYINTLLDRDFWVFSPDKYPDGYYTFSTRVRFHIFLGERFTYQFNKKKYPHKSITFFYELSSCDLYLISAITNSYLKPSDYLSLSFGLKLQLF